MYDPNIACISGLTIAPLFFFKVSRPFLNHSRDIRSSPSRSVINLPLALEIAKFRLSAGFPKDDLKIQYKGKTYKNQSALEFLGF